MITANPMPAPGLLMGQRWSGISDGINFQPGLKWGAPLGLSKKEGQVHTFLTERLIKFPRMPIGRAVPSAVSNTRDRGQS